MQYFHPITIEGLQTNYIFRKDNFSLLVSRNTKYFPWFIGYLDEFI